MMERLKRSLLFSLVCYVALVFLNSIAWIVIEFIPFLFHGDNPFYELQGATLLFYVPLVFVFSLIFNTSRVWIYFPVIYLIFSILIMFSNRIESWDLMFTVNFGFSQLSYVIYELIRNFNLPLSDSLNFMLFNGVFLIYQVGLLYYSSKLLNIFKKKFTVLK